MTTKRWSPEELEQGRAELARLKQEVRRLEANRSETTRYIAEKMIGVGDGADMERDEYRREVAAQDAELEHVKSMRDELRAELAERERDQLERERWNEQQTTNRVNRLLVVGAFVLGAVNLVLTILARVGL